ncbi:hypothetical protein ACWDZ6_16850 [Streptomyces sp. NPDC002926]
MTDDMADDVTAGASGAAAGAAISLAAFSRASVQNSRAVSCSWSEKAMARVSLSAGAVPACAGSTVAASAARLRR